MAFPSSPTHLLLPARKSVFGRSLCDLLLGAGAVQHWRTDGPSIRGVLRLLGEDVLEAQTAQEGSTEQELISVEMQTPPPTPHPPPRLLGVSEMICSSVFKASSHPTCAP